jgi:tetratricopeptide (TPR) repeat protein
MLVTLPLVLLLLDFWPLGRIPQAAAWKATALRLVAEKIPLFLLVAASSVVTYVAQQKGGAVVPTDVYPFSERVANALVAYVAYLAKTVWPADLAVFYPHSVLPWPQVAFSAVGLVVVTALAVAWLRRRPYVAVGWFWYVGTLVPVIGLVQVGGQAMADRYAYIPLVGIFVAAVWFVADVTAGWPHRMKALAAAAAVVGCGAVTFNQVGYWSDSETLFRHALEVTVDNPVAHYSLANALAAKGRMNDAIEHYREAIRFQPAFVKAHNNLGAALASQGRVDEAIREFREALDIMPQMAEAQDSLDALQAALREEIRINPSHAQAHHSLAMVCAALGQWPEAVSHAREAYRLAPEQPEALANLARILATAPDEKLRDGAEAVRLAERACTPANRRDPLMLDTLAAAYAEAGRFDDAVRTAEEALALASGAGQRNLAEDIRKRLALYRSGRPVRESGAAHRPPAPPATQGAP